LVYVYNTDSHKIDSCFRVLSQSINKNPIWDEEISGSESNDNLKVIYPYRWDAELICDNLGIDLQTIANISPFKGSINTKFLPIIRNNYPKPLNDPKYLEFRNFLLSKCVGMKIPRSDSREEQTAKYLILRTQPGSSWEDKEGQEYHYGTMKLVRSIDEVEKTARTIMKYKPKILNPSLTVRSLMVLEIRLIPE
jgi:hypothetical protein